VSKVLYSATMSLDGYIAGPGGDMAWLRPYLQPNPPIERLQQEIGALLVGGRTHRGDDPHRGTDREGAFEGTWDGPVFVVTRQPSTDEGSVHFVDEPQVGLEAAKAAAAGRYVNVLGAELARAYLDLGEVDEVLTIIAPVLLGGGTPLFAHPEGRQVRLERLDVQVLPHVTNVWHRVVRGPDPPSGHESVRPR
jgi:dihydrofolate reductase